jgi:putative acetyltransferase
MISPKTLPMLTIRPDDLSAPQTRDLLAYHHARMHAQSPPGTAFALDLSALAVPEITVWTAWDGDNILGIAALKTLPDGAGEVKSMRTHPDHLRKGVAAALLRHLMTEATVRGMTLLSLETGRGRVFEPALTLYRRHGFREGAPFADYLDNGFSTFLHLSLV